MGKVTWNSLPDNVEIEFSNLDHELTPTSTEVARMIYDKDKIIEISYSEDRYRVEVYKGHYNNKVHISLHLTVDKVIEQILRLVGVIQGSNRELTRNECRILAAFNRRADAYEKMMQSIKPSESPQEALQRMLKPRGL